MKITRRTALQGTAGAFALGLSGFNFDFTKAEAQAPNVKRGGTLNFAISAEAPHYDPHASDTYATLHFAAPFYSTLLRFNLSKFPSVEGDLAQSWTVAPDLMTYTFKLHPNVKFADGTAFTSADVKATYDRLRDPPQGVVSTRKPTFADIGSIETPDPLTIIFKMKAVNAAMLEHFASPWNVIYSAKDLAENPAGPRTKINGTGPFVFVEHVKGSHVAGKKNDNYFKKGMPYLDGFKGIFTLQAAAMLNAVQGGQVLGEFRGISPAERDRLVQAMGDKIRIEEDSWTLNLLVCFNVTKKPFDDVRVRKALLMAIDRWGGSVGLSKISTLRAVGGVLRPGSPYATPEAELVKLPGFSKDIKKSREEAKKLLKEAGQENLKFVLWNRNLAMPYTPAGVFLVDQWRQIGVEVEHKQSDTGPYLATMNAGNHDVAIDFSNLFMDDSSLALSKYLSLSRAPENRSRSTDPELDKLYDDHIRERDPEKRKALIRAFEKRVFEQGYQQPILWWHRIVPTHKALMGWKMSPSHNLGQQLEDVWINT
ncbi:ABC transporter substrate-binding protein [Undibacter mobilis]|uniref:ABC transporter substrate-binding protein n=1 Tax=Undibacter mobilis TaxID=2292256 RepID=A0A371BAS6_9BRAD|nr:ABC transporter substrate-binding protein [Undibacter mobilis]RDV04607.1 ABC transporter substrate-binding protein [Undibacter mobilis]